jgi:NAD(P)-dependent dehydrogenase (short-subunit alcohol dehydrogenase family)
MAMIPIPELSISEEQRVVLITGAGRGIGAATARELAGAGYAVVINYLRDQASAEKLQAEIHTNQTPCIALQADISSEQQVMQLFERVDEAFGRLDALVNNAGILEPQMPLATMTAARIERVMQTNVTGSLLCAREAVKRMSNKCGGRGGAIVNLSSMAARLGSPGEYIDYAASKGAIDSFTVGLAAEVADQGIRVNAVRPGIIHTDIHASGGEPGRVDRLGPGLPLGRGGTPEEVARAVHWLLSEQASYTTGSFIDVSGGR